MKQPRLRSQAYALAYASVLPHLQGIAREHGYTLAVHGSMATDLDLVAVPWIEDAADAETLIEALRVAVNGQFAPDHPDWEGDPGYRSHGRRAWSIYFSPDRGAPYLDISVMPRECEWGTEKLVAPFFREDAA